MRARRVHAAGARVRLVAVVAVLAALSACRTVPPAPVIGPGADAPWPEQRERLVTFDRYNLTGRVAVAANGQGFTASLRYEQLPRESNLSLDGPLGIGGLRVTLEGEDLRIETSRGEKLDGVAAREELERRLGFPLPLAELRWWLLGVPAPGGDGTERMDIATKEITRFVQRGWSVTIEKRMAALGFSLPQRLTAERAPESGEAGGGEASPSGASPAAPARLKLVVERWQ
jgi:outer membrane lipoprotein LolB